MKKALFPGTFDPPTLGHLDIIRRASLLCDELIVGLAFNPEKDPSLLSPEVRREMIEEITQDLPNITVVTFTGLMVDFALKHQVNLIIRSLRAASDLEFEFSMASANRKMSGLETLFLMADEKYSRISSSLVRQIGSGGRRLNDFVPAQIEERVFRAFKETKDFHHRGRETQR